MWTLPMSTFCETASTAISAGVNSGATNTPLPCLTITLPTRSRSAIDCQPVDAELGGRQRFGGKLPADTEFTLVDAPLLGQRDLPIGGNPMAVTRRHKQAP
jgi:hypothetical protein